MNKFITIVVALLFWGCSSMEPTNPSEESYPADFDVSVYAQLNTDIGYAQMRPVIVSLNKPRLDSIGNTKDSLGKAIARANFDADNKLFNADTLHLKYIITTFTGFPAGKWNDTISIPMKNVASFYNIQGYNSAQERAFYDSFQVDTTLIAYQYYYYGQAEGRPYKYCEAGAYGAPRDSVAPTSISAKGAVDYRPMTFCKNMADNIVYLNK